MASRQQGFSLIELMIVVAIIAILAAIAIPLYMNYSTEAEGSEGYMLADGVKEAVVSHFAQLGSWPTTNQDADLSPAASISGKYVESVKVNSTSAGSVIAVHFRTNGVAKALQDKYLYLSSMGESGSVHWVCQVEYTNMYRYVPTTCRNKH